MNTRKGFTLPELLIVLLVLGILVGIAFMVRGPVLSSARQTAWDSSLTTLTHALNNASLMNNDKYTYNTTASQTFTAFAGMTVSTGKTLAEYLDKPIVSPWNKNAPLMVINTALAPATDSLSGTAPKIMYSVHATGDHFAIGYVVDSTGSTQYVYDSMSAQPYGATYTNAN